MVSPKKPDTTEKPIEYRGRRTPYADAGIHQVPCARCGRPSRYQWTICSNNNNYMGVCEDCDIAVNKLLLRWFRFPNWKDLYDRYRKKVGG